MNDKKQGFTLIELLVVVAIIGLLSTLSIVALNNARARARDARRVADVKQIQTALELYYNDNGSYPPTASVVFNGSTGIGTGSNTYMAKVPAAPLPSDGSSCTSITNYSYGVDDSNRSYHINYCLGSATGGVGAGPRSATPGGIQ